MVGPLFSNFGSFGLPQLWVKFPALGGCMVWFAAASAMLLVAAGSLVATPGVTMIVGPSRCECPHIIGIQVLLGLDFQCSEESRGE